MLHHIGSEQIVDRSMSTTRI